MDAKEKRLEQIFMNLKMSDLKFEIKDQVGKGSFGTVYRATHIETGEKCAVKVIQKNQRHFNKESTQREINIHKELRHNHILRLFTSLEDDDNFYLILDYAKEGNLFDFLKNKERSEEHAAFAFVQTIKGFYYLHSNGIIHRDLKPENLLVFAQDNGGYTVKICDFTWAFHEQGDELKDMRERTTFCGTYEYMPPEMLKYNVYNF